MRIRSLRTTSTPKLMIIPMIDIIFFLLVFFMMSMLSMVVQKSMPVNLPPAESSKVDLNRKLPVTVMPNGQIYVEQEAVPVDQFVKRMQMEKAKGDNLTIILRADEKTQYQYFVQVLDTLKRIGIKNVSVATEKK